MFFATYEKLDLIFYLSSHKPFPLFKNVMAHTVQLMEYSEKGKTTQRRQWPKKLKAYMNNTKGILELKIKSNCNH